jgi:hypothetical protein
VQKTRGKLVKGLGKIILSDGDKYNTEILQFTKMDPVTSMSHILSIFYINSVQLQPTMTEIGKKPNKKTVKLPKIVFFSQDDQILVRNT